MNQSAFVRNVMTLISGKIGSQLLSIAFVPIVARLFTPEDFGVATIFVTTANLFSVILPLRYFRASLLTEDDYRAKMMQSLSAWLLLIGCVLCHGPQQPPKAFFLNDASLRPQPRPPGDQCPRHR